MGLHSYLAQQLIEYGSPESVEFTSIYFMLMNYWTLVESNNIARERGVTFHNFEKSDYANGTYFDKYTTGEFVPKSDRVKELFKDIFIPSAEDWAELRAKDLSATSMTYLLLSTQLHNGLKNVKRRKSVRSTTLQQDCQRKRFLTTLLPTTWICEKSSMSMLPQLNT